MIKLILTVLWELKVFSTIGNTLTTKLLQEDSFICLMLFALAVTYWLNFAGFHLQQQQLCMSKLFMTLYLLSLFIIRFKCSLVFECFKSRTSYNNHITILIGEGIVKGLLIIHTEPTHTGCDCVSAWRRDVTLWCIKYP